MKNNSPQHFADPDIRRALSRKYGTEEAKPVSEEFMDSVLQRLEAETPRSVSRLRPLRSTAWGIAACAAVALTIWFGGNGDTATEDKPVAVVSSPKTVVKRIEPKPEVVEEKAEMPEPQAAPCPKPRKHIARSIATPLQPDTVSAPQITLNDYPQETHNMLCARLEMGEQQTMAMRAQLEQ